MGWVTFWAEGVQGSPTNMGYTGVFVDTKANFPAAANGLKGSLAWASNELKLYFCDNSPAWVKCGQQMGGVIWSMPHAVLGTGAAIGQYGAVLTNGQDNYGHINFPIASNFGALVKAVVLVRPRATGNAYMTISTEFGANGEAYNANTDSIAFTTYAVTANQLYEWDITNALTGIAANDYVFASVRRDASNISDTSEDALDIVGILLTYT